MKIFLTTKYPQPLVDILESEFELEVNQSGKPLTKDEVKLHLKHADGVILLLNDSLDAEIIDAAPQLKVITLFAESLVNIDVEYATERGIMVTTTPGELSETTADLTWALLMAAARRIHEADAYVRAGKFQDWSPSVMLGGDVYGKTLGIVGLGKIGTAVARRAKGFNMKIIYTGSTGPKPNLEAELGCRYVTLDILLRESDFICLHCKLSPETEHLIGEKELSLMKDSSYLINTGRGKLVDEEALTFALRNKVIKGAGLDVYEFEPQVAKGLIGLRNVVLTPHIGVASIDNRYRMAVNAARNIKTALNGGVPENLANREALERRKYCERH
ncbi:MAG: D-glycerate dehydrogenase [Dethiobacter sp.]|nr:D-glycerate dehydrogenase [Dethiobacter sp.]